MKKHLKEVQEEFLTKNQLVKLVLRKTNFVSRTQALGIIEKLQGKYPALVVHVGIVPKEYLFGNYFIEQVYLVLNALANDLQIQYVEHIADLKHRP